jgi:hypothetical protein
MTARTHMPPLGMYICSICFGTGIAQRGNFAGTECDRCGGVGLLRPCRQRDCQEYGCTGFGDCEVEPAEAARHGFPTRRARDRLPELRSQADLEFSEHGRSPRFPPGWYIAPVAMFGAGLALLLFIVLI